MKEPQQHAYNTKQVFLLLDLYFRAAPRQTPWPVIAAAMGDPAFVNGLDDLFWKIVTGYAGNQADGPRRVMPRRTEHRAGRLWYVREDNALRAALGGEGQRRQPPCDVKYIANILARPVAEVQARWNELNKDKLGRSGFGL